MPEEVSVILAGHLNKSWLYELDKALRPNAIHGKNISRIHVTIVSNGGKSWWAQTIYLVLRRLSEKHGIEVCTYNPFAVESAANYIFLAGDARRCSVDATFMQHPATNRDGLTLTDIGKEMRTATTNFLDLMNDGILIEAAEKRGGNIYKLRTNVPPKKIEDMRFQEVVHDAETAIAEGICHSIGKFHDTTAIKSHVLIRNVAPPPDEMDTNYTSPFGGDSYFSAVDLEALMPKQARG